MDAPEPSFDVLKSSEDGAWSEAHASYWQDSDGFDQLWVKEPLQPLLAARMSLCNELKLKRADGGDDSARDDECKWAASVTEGEEDYGEAMSFPGYFETLSTDPRVYYYPQFLSDTEVESLRNNVSDLQEFVAHRSVVVRFVVVQGLHADQTCLPLPANCAWAAHEGQ